MKINAVDLFCGVGGLTCGVQQAGINVIAGYDIDPRSQFAYEFNNNARFILKDIKK
ncbi:DNA-cytosine methyltransferase [Streptococcus oralis]|uniref:DNA-cytosine methyltransferase n=2 Tax=Streptococcus TaxID=1301 RepID=A0A139PNU3_STROR|nr:DNA-cytosine methyltransferase [Streptococcus oralis]